MYVQQTYYHIYNRGVEKREIFLDEQDFAVWKSYISTYLLPKDTNELSLIISSETATTKEKDKALKLLRMNNFSNTITLHAYCFMPNHFHLLVHQKEQENIDQFMNSLGTRYAMYFNKKYRRVGPLFQGVYKAVRVTRDEQLLYLTKYIHRNPSHDSARNLRSYPYSSYRSYLGVVQEKWVDTITIPSVAGMNKSRYQAFIEEQKEDERTNEILKETVVDY